ncbi:uncharacterized mitochondrial protein-like protein [Tanacetum coccineum]
MASQFEMSDLGELTYYLGIEVSQGKDCVEIKQERYARKILKEAGMEDCNAPSYPMEKISSLSKARITKVERIDSSHNVDMMMDEALGHVFLPWYIDHYNGAHNKQIRGIISCEASSGKPLQLRVKPIWLRELLAVVTGMERQKVIVEAVNPERSKRKPPITKCLWHAQGSRR